MTKESPCGTIRSRVDVVFVTRYDHSCRWRSWAVSENCTVLNKSFVCERVVGNEDSWAEACVNGDDESVKDKEAFFFFFPLRKVF